MTLRYALLAAALLCATAARADEAAPTPAAKEQASLQSFGAAHVECLEWNDGCATCTRTMSVHCSTPGIACLPGAIVCKTP